MTTPGWHRLRAAVGNDTPSTYFELRYDPPDQPGAFRVIPAARLRAAVGDVPGLAVDGFDEPHLLVPAGTTLSTDALVGLTLAPDPYGLPIGIQTWTLRWAGQVRIDVEGTYQFELGSLDGHRAWLGGTLIADTIDAPGAGLSPPPVPLVAGWHDLVIDLQQQGNSDAPMLGLKVADGPAWVGGGIPVENLRPVVGRAVRWAADANLVAAAIPDGAATSRFLGLDLPAAATPLRIDVGYIVTHPLLASLQVVLDPPVGVNQTLAAVGSLAGSGTRAEHREVPIASAGAAWSVIVTDAVVDGLTGSVAGAAITALYRGGPPPFAASARYTSAVRALGEVTGFGPLTWVLRQPSTARAPIVRLRTCAQAEACAAEPWVEVVDGAVPAVPVRPFAQYQVELRSDGDVPTALDWIELVYTIAE